MSWHLPGVMCKRTAVRYNVCEDPLYPSPLRTPHTSCRSAFERTRTKPSAIEMPYMSM